MFVDLSKISSTAKVWVYLSDRKMNTQEFSEITLQLQDFCNTWTTHDKTVVSSFKIYNWCVLLFVDEKICDISGCSIDKSISLIKSLGQKYNIDFFNRSNILFVDKNNMTQLLPLFKFKEIISPDIIVYNTLIKNKFDFEENWKVPVYRTWLNQFIS